jgi:hypothetical protein
VFIVIFTVHVGSDVILGLNSCHNEWFGVLFRNNTFYLNKAYFLPRAPTLNYLNYVGFEVLTTVSAKMAVFWVVAPCGLVEFTNVSEVLAASIIRAMSTHSPDDGGSQDL